MIPQNEQGVISLFSEKAGQLGYTFIEIGTRCPDAILEKDNIRTRVEFEYLASNFKKHKHNPSDVDLIICWENDWDESPIPVLSMQNYMALLTQGKEPAPALWQRPILLFHGIIETWYTARQKMIRVKMENIACPICGAKMSTRCEYGFSIYNIMNGRTYESGLAYRSCKKCGFTTSEKIRYHSGWIRN